MSVVILIDREVLLIHVFVFFLQLEMLIKI